MVSSSSCLKCTDHVTQLSDLQRQLNTIKILTQTNPNLRAITFIPILEEIIGLNGQTHIRGQLESVRVETVVQNSPDSSEKVEDSESTPQRQEPLKVNQLSRVDDFISTGSKNGRTIHEYLICHICLPLKVKARDHVTRIHLITGDTCKNIEETPSRSTESISSSRESSGSLQTPPSTDKSENGSKSRNQSSGKKSQQSNLRSVKGSRLYYCPWCPYKSFSIDKVWGHILYQHKKNKVTEEGLQTPDKIMTS